MGRTFSLPAIELKSHSVQHTVQRKKCQLVLFHNAVLVGYILSVVIVLIKNHLYTVIILSTRWDYIYMFTS